MDHCVIGRCYAYMWQMVRHCFHTGSMPNNDDCLKGKWQMEQPLYVLYGRC